MKNFIEQRTLAHIETTLNRLIELDPAAQQNLSELEGKTIAIAITQPTIECTALFSGQSIILFPGFDPRANARIQGSAIHLARYAVLKPATPVGQGLRLSGEQHLLLQAQRIASQLDIDWEEPLSRYIGDIGAYQIGQAARQFFSWSKQSINKLTEAAEMYAHDELDLSPSQPELNHYLNEVDRISAATSRLEIATAKLEQRLAILNTSETAAVRD